MQKFDKELRDQRGPGASAIWNELTDEENDDSCYFVLYFSRLADSVLAIILYLVVNRRFKTLYGITTGSLSAYY